MEDEDVLALADLMAEAVNAVTARLAPQIAVLALENDRIGAELRQARRHLHRIENREAKLRQENAELQAQLAPPQKEQIG